MPIPCAPRPQVGVSALPDTPGRLRVTVTANTNANTPSNALGSLRFGDPRAMDNALIDIPGGPTGMSTAFTHTLPASTTSFQFFVRRAAGGATTAFVVVVDGCGDWPTFVGGGPSAF